MTCGRSRTLEQVRLWRSASPLKAALHIDTGMNRLGFRPEAFRRRHAENRLQSLVMSHLACADARG